jgi:ribonuclease Z
MHQKRAFLFDAGKIENLSSREIMKITHLFISHTHIDHFIGFDLILRVLLKRESPLSVFGPEGMISAVENKLGGYTWNRITEYPVKLNVFDITHKKIVQAGFYANNSFKKQLIREGPFNGTLFDENGIKVNAMILDHDVPCMAYSVEEPQKINIMSSIIAEMGFETGKWLNELKEAVRNNAQDDHIFKVSGKEVRLGELRGALKFTRGQKISYVTDINPTEDNTLKVIDFVRKSTNLYIEACFLDSDMDLAIKRNHITGAIAGEIARKADVLKLSPMHMSRRYFKASRTPLEEALDAFNSNI